MKYYIGIDLGGTNIVAGVVNEAYEILAKARPVKSADGTQTHCAGPGNCSRYGKGCKGSSRKSRSDHGSD